MNGTTRREFLADVGRGMFIASLGSSLACDLGLAPAFAESGDDKSERLSFGPFEPLVSLLQDTPADRLLPVLVERLRNGATLRELTAAAALANARTFGGEHYRGFHAFMALAPAYQMAGELPEPQRPLPVLKVLYRNTEFMQSAGGSGNEILRPVAPVSLNGDGSAGELLCEAKRHCDEHAAERVFAAMAAGSPEHALNDLLQFNVEHQPGVHEIVMVWRAWSLLDLTGREHAHTLLRQSVRQCIDASERGQPPNPLATSIPSLLDRHA
ncbi:MAG: hypothetical protein ACREIV_11805, partial [Planctomycetaceae bacterium]